MPASIGVNLRVTGHCSQGGRKYMEDLFSVAYQQTEDERDLEYAFFGIYDGHGGSEAAAFAKEHLMDSIVKQRQFWSDNDEDVLKAIRNGYMLTHMNMWKELEKWPKTVTGLPSTAGTTASIAFIRRGKIYIGHVGDSAIVLGYQKEGCEEWCARALTSEHKPEAHGEMERIERCGGKVVAKAGVPRVVWSRPRPPPHVPHQPAVDEIPFLAVARSLGDLWSYNAHRDEFIVSPDPDVGVLPIDPSKFRCLIFGTDGLWNMLSAESAVKLVQATERHNEAALVAGSDPPRHWLNPSKSLVDHALERWSNTRMRADNTSVVTLMLDPPGPPRAAVLRARSSQRPARAASPTPQPAVPAPAPTPPPVHDPPQNGLTIMTRYSDTDRAPAQSQTPPLPPCATLDGRFSLGTRDDGLPDATAGAPGATTGATTTIVDADRGYNFVNYGNPAESSFMTRLLHRTRLTNTLGNVYDEIVNTPEPAALTDIDVPHDSPPAAEQAPASPARDDTGPAPDEHEGSDDAHHSDDSRIQINEVSSSSPTDGPPRPRARRHHPAPSARVLRSQDAELHTVRPHTRRAAARAKPPDPAPSAPPAQPTLERVVILNRARGVPVAPAVLRVSAPVEARAAPRRSQLEPSQTPVTAADTGRVTRSKDSVSLPLTQKITRSISNVARELRGHSQPAANAPAPAPVTSRPGNSVRAPGPPRRSAPGPRAQNAHLAQSHSRTECSKENFGAARRRRAGARARGLLGLAAAHLGPASNGPDAGARPARLARRIPVDEDGAVEVHSTTDDTAAASGCGGEPKTATAPRPRALRSRNDAEPSTPVAATRRELSKRPPPAVPALSPAPKAAKLVTPVVAAERCTRALAKRASGPWAPALALRNRLRKRLAK